MTHVLKTHPEYFQAVVSGHKKFEIRKNDRDFKVGDTLVLQEYHPTLGYSRAEIAVSVTYILDAQPYVPEGYVCMSIVPYIS